MEEFKLIVAGGRTFQDSELLAACIDDLANGLYEEKAISIVSGMAQGADRMAWVFARDNNVKCYEFPADWDDIHAPGAVIRRNYGGKPYNANAGFVRNKAMGDFADGLLAFWDGQSKGTKDMIDYMLLTLKRPVHIVRYDMDNTAISFNTPGERYA